MGNAVSCGCGGLAPGAVELIEAAKTGDVDVGLAALVSGTDVRCYDSAGWTALHHAVRNDHLLFAKMLLSQGASPDAENNNESTPLMMVQSDEMRILLKSFEQRSALSFFFNFSSPGEGEGQADSSALPASHQPAARPTPAEAVAAAELAVARAAARAAAPADAPVAEEAGEAAVDAVPPTSELRSATHQHPPPESAAACSVADDVASLALQPSECADGDASADAERLVSAALAGDLPAARAALDGGCDPNLRDGEGWTALHGACNGGHRELAQLLCDRGAHVDAANAAGWTALHLCARAGDASMVAQLIDAGASLEAVTAEGWTPLHSAARAAQLACAQLLIERGANTAALTHLGRTPLDMAKTALQAATHAAGRPAQLESV